MFGTCVTVKSLNRMRYQKHDQNREFGQKRQQEIEKPYIEDMKKKRRDESQERNKI